MNDSVRLLAILADERFSDEASDAYMSDAVADMARDIGWTRVDSAMIEVLRDVKLASYWYDVAACLFCADCHKRELPCEPTCLIALLHDCLGIRPDLGVEGYDPDDADNLVWSITHSLKGVGYLSDYDPRTDPEILSHRIAR